MGFHMSTGRIYLSGADYNGEARSKFALISAGGIASKYFCLLLLKESQTFILKAQTPVASTRHDVHHTPVIPRWADTLEVDILKYNSLPF